MSNAATKWALILGGSSGLGLATAHKLAAHGFSIIVVHRDARASLPSIEEQFNAMRKLGVNLISFNADATNTQKQEELLSEISQIVQGDKISVLVHSIAKGNLKPMVSAENPTLEKDDFALTIQAMAISFYQWSKHLINQQLLAEKARLVAFTSEGNQKAWRNYAAVSAAKASLEAIMRNMALEFAPLSFTANCIQAGVTETKSFQMIPGHEALKQAALVRNPFQRLTQPEDVANAVYLLTLKEADWINGTVIKVDGGESLQ